MTETHERWLFKSRKYGTKPLGPRVTLPRSATLEERFAAKVEVTESGCWLWLGSRSHGYGMFRADRLHRAHRWAFKHWRGPVDDDLTMDHLCQNRSCANPWHVEPVTRLENIRRNHDAEPPTFPPAPSAVAEFVRTVRASMAA